MAFLVVFTFLLGLGSAWSSSAVTWRETSLQDFADGSTDPAMYVSRRADLDPDSGCVEFSTWFDVNHDGHYDLICSDNTGPSLHIYLGSDSGYSPSRVLTYPVTYGAAAMFADLDMDRNPELIHSCQLSSQTTIYQGTDSGPSRSSVVTLTGHGRSEAINAADFDHDGYLDIIVGCWDGSGQVTVYWGSANGYSSANRSTIAVGYNVCANIDLADFNRDGWMDAVLARDHADAVIYFGPGRQAQVVDLPFAARDAHGMSVADLNDDGWVDAILTEYQSLHQSYIYWGGPTGFSTSRRTVLSVNQAYGGSAVADLNQDGRLDIVYFCGYGLSARPIVFHNTGAFPYFDDSHSSQVGPFGVDANGGIAVDLNDDSIQDLFVCANGTSDYILWGPGFTSYAALPVQSDHHGTFREPGNVYDRSLTAWYFSSVYDAGLNNRVSWGTCSWTAYEPGVSSVGLAFRSGATPQPDSSWSQFAEVPSNGGTIPVECLGERYVQYRATFAYPRPDSLPDLEEVTSQLTVNSVNTFDVGVERILVPRDSVPLNSPQMPCAVIRNYGNQTAGFPATFTIGSTYTDTRNLNLAPGETDTVPFAGWNAAPAGLYAVKCSTGLVGDSNPGNDRDTTWVVVVAHDVGAARIIAPTGQANDGDTLYPVALVRNFGSLTESFDVVFNIGNVFTDTTHVSNLGPGASLVVSFQPWTARTGFYATLCSTMLTTDGDHSNDAVHDSLMVGTPIRDVGAIEIVQPRGVIQSDDSVRPEARVRNFGNTRETFPVVFRIGTAYAEVVNVAGLAPDSVRTIAFPFWYAVPGTYAVGCSTMLSSDVNDTNDMVSESLSVVQRSLLVMPDTSSWAYPGTAVTYNVRVINLGLAPDTVDVWISELRARWSAQLLDSTGAQLRDNNGNGRPDIGELPAGDTAFITARVLIPVDELANTLGSTSVMGRSCRDTSLTDAALLDTRVLGVARVMIEPDHCDSVAAGEYVDYQCRVSNLGNALDIVDLEMVHVSSPSGWTYELLDVFGMPLPDLNQNGRPDVGALSPLTGWADFILRVTAPDSGAAGIADTTQLWAVSGNDPSVREHATCVTQVAGRLTLFRVEPDQSDKQFEGSTRFYRFYVKTEGNVTDLAQLSLAKGDDDWQVSLRDSSGANPLELLGPIQPGVPAWFSVQVQAPNEIPDNLAGNPDSLSRCVVRVIGVSQTDSRLSDTALLDIQAIPGLAIHNYENPFRDRTTFIFSVPRQGKVSLAVYQRTGELVCRLLTNKDYEPGIYTLPWQGLNRQNRKLSPGTYLYVFDLTAGDHTERVEKKLMIR